MSDLPAGHDTTKRARFPIGGPREPVYAFLRSRGFVMSRASDKQWSRADGVDLHLYGSGSMARIYDSSGLLVDAPLAEAVARAAFKGKEA